MPSRRLRSVLWQGPSDGVCKAWGFAMIVAVSEERAIAERLLADEAAATSRRSNPALLRIRSAKP
jgi:hypothetical protein